MLFTSMSPTAYFNRGDLGEKNGRGGSFDAATDTAATNLCMSDRIPINSCRILREAMTGAQNFSFAHNVF